MQCIYFHFLVFVLCKDDDDDEFVLLNYNRVFLCVCVFCDFLDLCFFPMFLFYNRVGFIFIHVLSIQL